MVKLKSYPQDVVVNETVSTTIRICWLGYATIYPHFFTLHGHAAAQQLVWGMNPPQ